MSQHFAPKKSLGQHFLKDSSTAKKIADFGKINSQSLVIEIGPGRGALTDHLIAAEPKKLVLLEKDTAYANFHADKNLPNLEVVSGDALKYAWQKLGENLEEEWIIMGNLPYNVASPLMWDIVSQVPKLQRAVFLIQKEVADRIVAVPDNKHYGALSVWIQTFVQAKKVLTLPPGAFNPPPKVDSAVVVFTPKSLSEAVPENLAKLIKICFSQRRKQMLSIFKNNKIEKAEEILAQAKITPTLRPENLSLEQFWDLAKLIK